MQSQRLGQSVEENHKNALVYLEQEVLEGYEVLRLRGNQKSLNLVHRHKKNGDLRLFGYFLEFES